MREAFRRPTGNGVRDPTLELLGLVLVLPSVFGCSRTPLLSPHWPCAYRPADPTFAGRPLFWRPKSHPKFHSIFEGILAPKMVPEASPNGAQLDLLGCKFVTFSCYFLASFLDACLEASGCIFGVMLVVIGRFVLILFLTL